MGGLQEKRAARSSWSRRGHEEKAVLRRRLLPALTAGRVRSRCSDVSSCGVVWMRAGCGRALWCRVVRRRSKLAGSLGEVWGAALGWWAERRRVLWCACAWAGGCATTLSTVSLTLTLTCTNKAWQMSAKRWWWYVVQGMHTLKKKTAAAVSAAVEEVVVLKCSRTDCGSSGEAAVKQAC